MTLPKITYPIFDITIPSTKKKMKFRPYTVAEEKILLIGQQSKEPRDMYEALKQVINNCVVDKLDFDKLAPFDFDYIFIKLRAQSISNVVEIKYSDPEDSEEYIVKVNLDEVEVTFPEGTSDPIIQCDEKIKVKLCYPTMKIMDQLIQNDTEEDAESAAAQLTDKLIVKSIETIMSGDEIYPAAETSEKELTEFVNSIPSKPYALMREFFENTPQVKHTVKYTTKGGTERSIELNGLADFFMF